DVEHRSSISMDCRANWHWTDGAARRKLSDMSATLISPSAQMTRLVPGIRGAIDVHADWARTAQLVADQLRARLPGPDVLTPEQRRGSADRCRSHTLHGAPGGR